MSRLPLALRRSAAEAGRLWRILALSAVAIGTVLRLEQFIRARSLWLDEAMLALNIGLRGPFELLRPLDLAQNAPVLYLWALKGCGTVLGMSAPSLRLPSLLAGLLLPALMWQVARRALAPAPAAFATGLAALAPGLVLYSRELKPYGVEAALSLALLAAALAWREQPRQRSTLALLAVVCLLNVSASIPGILVVVASLAALATSRRVAAARCRGRLVGLAAASSLLFVALVAGVYLEEARSGYLQRFWAGTSLQAPPRQWPNLLRDGLYAGANGLLRGKPSVWEDLPGKAWAARLSAYGGLLLAAAGWTGLHLRGRRTVALLLSLPFAALLAASLLAGYPLAPRLLLFLSPQALLLMAAGMEETARRVPGRLRVPLMAVVATAFLGPAALRATEWGLTPPQGRDAEPVLSAVPDLLQPGDVIYVGARGFPVWLFATTDWRGGDLDADRRLVRLASPGGPAFHSGPFPGSASPAAAGLSTTFEGHTVLVGKSPGIDFTARGGFQPPDPAPGWAPGEAERIRQAASPCALLVFPFDVDGSSRHLIRALGALGIRPGKAVASGRSRAVRLCPGPSNTPDEGA